jgi:uncharacterized protein YabN with tetrapyrrole methylase and pyrophosphatase domain
VESGPVRELLDGLPPGTVTALDEEYERGASFEETYRAIVGRVLSAAEAGDVVYAVPGHPLMGETTVALLLAETKARGVAVRVFPRRRSWTPAWNCCKCRWIPICMS